MPQILNLPGIDVREYAQVFTALDVNNDNGISINEFKLFIEGAKADKQQRMSELDPAMVQQMRAEVAELFRQFDINGDGFVEAEEIMRSMLALGHHITLQDAQSMIRQVDTEGFGKLRYPQFEEMMLKKMMEELLSQDDNVEELRAKFLDADVDHSGTLTVDEIHGVFVGMGIELDLEELVQLMNEIDVDRSGSLDIDEFIALMTTTGQEM